MSMSGTRIFTLLIATTACGLLTIAAPASGSTTAQGEVGEARPAINSPAVVNTLVDEGQFVSISAWGLACGHNERMTDSYIRGMVQKALIYRHCATSGSVRRRADAILDKDGPCYSIPAGTARVLQAKFVFPRTVWRGAYAC